jgi:hypothetical protein
VRLDRRVFLRGLVQQRREDAAAIGEDVQHVAPFGTRLLRTVDRALLLQPDISTGSATLTTEPSIKAMLDPRIVATRTQIPTLAGQDMVVGPDRITASSQGAFTKFAIFSFLSSLCGNCSDLFFS